MLAVDAIETCYGRSQILFGVSLRVERGEVVTLLGRNGMGKTTTVKSILGLAPIRGGSIIFEGERLSALPPYRVAQRGLSCVPEGRRIFPNLTVRENLVATAANRRGATNSWTLDRVLSLFPRLSSRLGHYGNQLSGGEQQMLAIGRALMTNPLLLILDEATEGLAPVIREEIWRCLEALKQGGQSLIVIDKNLQHLLRLGDRHYVLAKGRVVWEGSSAMLRSDKGIRERYLGV